MVFDLRGSLRSVGVEVDRLNQLTESLILLAHSVRGKLPLDLFAIHDTPVVADAAPKMSHLHEVAVRVLEILSRSVHLFGSQTRSH